MVFQSLGALIEVEQCFVQSINVTYSPGWGAWCDGCRHLVAAKLHIDFELWTVQGCRVLQQKSPVPHRVMMQTLSCSVAMLIHLLLSCRACHLGELTSNL